MLFVGTPGVDSSLKMEFEGDMIKFVLFLTGG